MAASTQMMKNRDIFHLAGPAFPPECDRPFIPYLFWGGERRMLSRRPSLEESPRLRVSALADRMRETPANSKSAKAMPTIVLRVIICSFRPPRNALDRETREGTIRLQGCVVVEAFTRSMSVYGGRVKGRCGRHL
jgi:hypothetical protein